MSRKAHSVRTPTFRSGSANKPGAHLLQGDVVLLPGQAAQAPRVRVELRGAGAALGTGSHRSCGVNRSHPADRRVDPVPSQVAA